MGKRLCSFLTICLLIGGSVFAQKTITGKVVDAQTGEPVVGASVLVQGTTLGQAADLNGDFTIQNVPNSATTLKVSYIGMKEQLVTIKPKMRIYMQPEVTETDEVLVVAYGTATKSSFTGSASVIDAQEIASEQSTNLLNALNGKSAGVQVFNQSNQPGASSPSIRIRGISSINAGNSPLIILDGAPFDGDINAINASDIENMTVLKDAASNALYGARGANGVIMITTKNGKPGDNAKITLDAKWGVNSRATRRYKTINDPALYYETYYNALKNYALKNGYDDASAHAFANANLIDGSRGLGYNVYTVPQGQYLIGTNGKLNPAATMGNYVTYKDETYYITSDDWLDEAYKNGTRQEYTVTASNSVGGTNFYSSFNYLNTEGITENSGYERISGRLKADSQLKPWLKVGGNMSFAHYEGKTMGEDGSFNSSGNPIAVALQTSPVYPLYIRDANGNIKIDEYGNTMYDYGDGKNAGLQRPVWANTNALSEILLDTDKYEGNTFNAVGFAEIRFLKDFTLSSTNSANVDETRSSYVRNPYYGSYASSNGIVSKYHTRSYSYNFQQLLNWNHQFDLHDVGVMLGHESYTYKYAYLYGNKNNMFDPNNIELAGAINDGSSNSYTTKYNTEGYFGRVLYNYDQKYFGSLSYRRDASSRFHKDNRWGSFWSVGGAWIISKESWFPHHTKGIDVLKLKASYGENGNDNIGNFRYTNTYSLSNYNGNPAVRPSAMGNKNITWETVGNFNAGIEFELLGSRLNGSVEYFYRKTSDMLFSLPLPTSFGYTSYYTNIGDMRNSGIEITLDADIVRYRDFVWNVDLNFTHYKNKLIYMPEELKTQKYDGVEGFVSGNYVYGEGIPLYNFYLPQYAGVNEETGAQQWYYNIEKTDENGEQVVVGKGITEDYSKADYYRLGSALPDAYGGFGTTITWKGFDFSMDFAYQIGGLAYDSDYQSLMGAPTASGHGDAMHADILKAWTPSNTSSDIPYYWYGDTYAVSTSSRFLTDASYLAINNITLGYTLPAVLTKRFGIEKIRLYGVADNVFLWSRRQGFDPRQSIAGSITSAYYAPIRSISGGISLTF